MRASGILLPVSSLPSRFGIGCFSSEAYEFVDQLVRAGQRYWQILPLGPTGYGDSPYQSFSAFAGNPYFIDFDMLNEEGILAKSDYENEDFGQDKESIDYGLLFKTKYKRICELLSFKKFLNIFNFLYYIFASCSSIEIQKIK